MLQRLRRFVARLGRPAYAPLRARLEADLRTEALRAELAEQHRRITRLEARLQNEAAITRRLAALEDALRAREAVADATAPTRERA